MLTTISATQARANLFRLMETVDTQHSPLIITGKKTNTVLISEKDWEAIQETLYLLSIPKMRESIIKGMETPIEECSKELDW